MSNMNRSSSIDTTIAVTENGTVIRRRINYKTIWKIGLASTLIFHFLWVGKQLHSMSSGGEDELLGDTPVLDSHHDGATITRIIPKRTTATTQNPFDPREKSLAMHPHPNAELMEIVGSNHPYSCPEGLVYVEDHILPDNITHPQTIDGKPARLLPNLLHITAKSRCMSQGFANNINKWKHPNALGSKYSIYIHDDTAMDKFIYEREWIEFPELKEVIGCVTAGAAKAGESKVVYNVRESTTIASNRSYSSFHYF